MCAYIHVIKGQNVSCKKFSNSVKHILAMKKKLKKKNPRLFHWAWTLHRIP